MTPAISERELRPARPDNDSRRRLLCALAALAGVLVTAVLAHHAVHFFDGLGHPARHHVPPPAESHSQSNFHLGSAALFAAHGGLLVEAAVSLAVLGLALLVLIFCPLEVSLAGAMPPLVAVIAKPDSLLILLSGTSALLVGLTIKWALRQAALRRQGRENPLLINQTETV